MRGIRSIEGEAELFVPLLRIVSMDDLDRKIRFALVQEGYLFPITDAEIEWALKETKKEYMKPKYWILCLNCAHPTNDAAFFLLTDQDDNTVLFGTKDEAKAYCRANESGPFAYTILCTDDFNYE